METLLEKVIMKHIDTWTPEEDRSREKDIISAALDLHKHGRMTAYQVLELYDLHKYFPGQN
jgi:hypothetical protein